MCLSQTNHRVIFRLVHAYVRTRLSKKHPTLADFLSNVAPEEDDDAASTSSKGEAYWPDYLSADALKLGIHNGELRQGRFFASRQNLTEATVSLDVRARRTTPTCSYC